ncbi:MAG: hypothetical protein F6J90_01860 [Moorea sp. SIOASIH]|nr:hypothetical protein [Moorena sp. SIOASIH]
MNSRVSKINEVQSLLALIGFKTFLSGGQMPFLSWSGLYHVRIISDKTPSGIKPYSFPSAFCLLPSIRGLCKYSTGHDITYS